MWVERCFNLALRFKYKVSSFASYPGCVRATVWVPDRFPTGARTTSESVPNCKVHPPHLFLASCDETSL